MIVLYYTEKNTQDSHIKYTKQNEFYDVILWTYHVYMNKLEKHMHKQVPILRL